MRRLFTKSERFKLFVASEGLCEGCGEPLPEGWHAHHKIPYSRGGPTLLENGAALCTKCHAKEHQSMEAQSDGYSRFNKDYSWQERAVEALFNDIGLYWNEKRGAFNQAFVLEVSPSGGKTKFSLKAARELIHAGLIDRAFWIVPRDSIKDGFRRDAEDVILDEEFHLNGGSGIQIDTNLPTNYKGILRNFHGAVITYQALSSFLGYFRLLANAGHRLLFVFDEIHHGRVVGEDDPCANEWGKAIAEVRDISHSVICMTGTPVRTDQGMVPFFKYKRVTEIDPVASKIREGLYVEASFKFTYKDAIIAGVARKLIFRHQNPVVNFKHRKDDDEREYNGELAGVSLNLVDYAKRQLFSPERGHIDEMLKVAYAENQLHRKIGDAAAAILVVVGSTDEESGFNPLIYVSNRIRKLFGESATAVESKDLDASDAIKNFKDSSQRWIVAKDMISEGTSIPRIRVVLVLRDIKSEVKYQQTVHRATRNASNDVAQDAIVIHFHLPEMVSFATAIEEDVRLVIPKPRPTCPSCLQALEFKPRCGQPCTFCGYEPEMGGETTPHREYEWLDSKFGQEDVIQGAKNFSRYDPLSRALLGKLGQNPWYGGRHGINEILKAADEGQLISLKDAKEESLFTAQEQMERYWNTGLSHIGKAAAIRSKKNNADYSETRRNMTADCKRAANMGRDNKETVMRDYKNPLETFKRFEDAARRILDSETGQESRKSA